MRLTITIDDQVHAEAKAIAARSGRTLSAVVEDALRSTIARSRPAVEATLPTFPGGLRPGVDLDDGGSLLDLMDEPHSG